MSKTSEEFERLVSIMARLRAPDVCPWDREQTHESLRPYLLEEAYEVLDAIDRQAHSEMRKELGDLLLQIIFHARIAEEEGRFSMEEIVRSLNEKLISRHPHIFGEKRLENAKEVVHQWEQIKLNEGEKKGLLDGVPKAQPALNRAFRVQEKAAGVGFEWPHIEGVWEKLDEEVREFRAAMNQGDARAREEEFGDFLFSLVNLARYLKINPEDALRNTVEKFIRRFQYIEEKISSRGRSLAEATLEEMDELWEESKSFL
jgi:tetrapyrrole methylase family protein/MazG family protein